MYYTCQVHYQRLYCSLTTLVKSCNVEERRTTLSVGVTRLTTMSEWAQLLAGPPAPHAALERGYWYRVEARTKDGIVRVMGPNAVGRPVAESLVRIVNHEPERVTRVQATGFQRVLPGQPPPEVTYYGVCPKRHRIYPLRIGDSNVECRLCARTYELENEQHI